MHSSVGQMNPQFNKKENHGDLIMHAPQYTTFPGLYKRCGSSNNFHFYVPIVNPTICHQVCPRRRNDCSHRNHQLFIVSPKINVRVIVQRLGARGQHRCTPCSVDGPGSIKKIYVLTWVWGMPSSTRDFQQLLFLSFVACNIRHARLKQGSTANQARAKRYKCVEANERCFYRQDESRQCVRLGRKRNGPSLCHQNIRRLHDHFRFNKTRYPTSLERLPFTQIFTVRYDFATVEKRTCHPHRPPMLECCIHTG